MDSYRRLPAILSRANSGRLVGRVVEVASLAPEQRDRMWSVFGSYYAEVSRPVFERDLNAKQQVILLQDSGDGSIQGFSTIQVYKRAVDGRPFVAVFSGDTIVEEAYWGQSALQRTFVRFLIGQKLRHPFTPVYWYLISKGYKTYLLLARNFPSHWPRCSSETPARERAIIDQLSTEKYGEAYLPAAGVLRFTECQGRLKDGIAPIEPGSLAQPDVRFFVEANPGHAKGDELCCLGRVDFAFPLHFLGRQVRKTVSQISRSARRIWAVASASS